MQKIKLKTGKEFSVNWCGVANIDGILRAEIVNSTFSEIASDFCDKEKTSEITYFVNENPAVVFEGYTDVVGINSNYAGIVVALKKEAT